MMLYHNVIKPMGIFQVVVLLSHGLSFMLELQVTGYDNGSRNLLILSSERC